MKRFLFAVLLTACAPAPAPRVVIVPPPVPTPIASAAPPEDPEAFRSKAPTAGPAVPFVAPKIVEHKLANGVRILLVERHELPIVAFQIVVDRGADQGPPGVGAFLGAMLVQGTKSKSALEISDTMGKLGAQFGSWGNLDSIGVSGKVLAAGFPEAFALLAECIRNPALSKHEIERERSKRLTSLAQQKDSPQIILRNSVSEVLYPESHPYHAPLLGTEPALKKLTAQDLAALHKKLVEPEDITVAISGDITREQAVAEVTKVLGSWKGKPDSVPELQEPPEASGPRIVIIDRPGATQSHLAATLVGVPRANKDFHALQVMNTILGGQFSSRLNLNLREKHAYTYGAGSSFDMRHGPGPFTAGGAIVREATTPATLEILSELKRIAETPVTDEELEVAKANLIRRLPGSFETVSDVAGSVAYLSIYNLPLDEFDKRVAGYNAVTKDDIQRVAKLYLRSERLRIVIVGDADVIEKDLDKLNLGKPEIRRAPPPPPAKK